ncbi:MAG: hypothetical protein JJE28_10730 [Actinomycetales bacterium]|nr:hypothetical protein [Actinomycetales bacterium]
MIIDGIGGESGCYSLPVTWSARGLMDKMVGGAVDFWRVERVDHGIIFNGTAKSITAAAARRFQNSRAA